VQGRKDAKLQKRLKDELAWVRSGVKARQAKSKARLQRYEEMAAEAEKTRKLDFEEIQIPTGPRLGSVVVEVEHLDKGFDGPTAHQGPVVHAAAQRHRRRHRPERRRQDDAVQDRSSAWSSRTAARSGSATRSS
jgi:ATPase subunit of ABC transporter with duplicated ATPase domains